MVSAQPGQPPATRATPSQERDSSPATCRQFAPQPRSVSQVPRVGTPIKRANTSPAPKLRRYPTPVKHSGFRPRRAQRLLDSTLVVVAHPELDVERSDRRRPGSRLTQRRPMPTRSTPVRQATAGGRTSRKLSRASLRRLLWATPIARARHRMPRFASSPLRWRAAPRLARSKRECGRSRPEAQGRQSPGRASPSRTTPTSREQSCRPMTTAWLRLSGRSSVTGSAKGSREFYVFVDVGVSSGAVDGSPSSDFFPAPELVG